MTVVKNPKSCDCDISEVVGNSYQIDVMQERNGP